MDIDKVKSIYFVGIGGIGMSAAAGIAKAKGYDVSGSESSDVYEPALGVLQNFQINFKVGYAAENFKGADLMVTTAAVDQSNPEVEKAIAMGTPIVSYPELLGVLVQDKKRIVVTGTHGKGTTSGLIGYALKNLEDDSFFVGAVLNNLQTNFYYGNGAAIVMEGDEYKSSHENLRPKFSYYRPNVLLINNLEFDHPDLYPDLKAIKKVFMELAEDMPEDGIVVFNADEENVVDVVQNTKAKKISFGFSESAQIRGQKPKVENGLFVLPLTSQLLGTENQSFEVKSRLPGMPYAYDNIAAAAVLIACGFAPEQFKKYFEEYAGVKRRYEIVQDDTVTIIDDYAHHPTAVKQTIEATREKYPGRRIVCFFEPHTYSRTKETLSELKDAFVTADLVYIAEVYPAREQKLPSSITGKQVVAEIISAHPQMQDKIFYVANKADALEKYASVEQKGDVVLVMAVGSFNTLAYTLAEINKDKNL